MQNNLKFANLEKDSTKSQKDYAELKKSCDALCNRIDSAKNLIIDFASLGWDPKPTYETLLSDYSGNYDLPKDILFTNMDKPKAVMTGIKSDIQKLNILLKEKFHKEDLSLLDIRDVDTYGNLEEGKTSWENSKFCRVPFELVMINFNQLELDVRMAESSCL